MTDLVTILKIVRTNASLSSAQKQSIAEYYAKLQEALSAMRSPGPLSASRDEVQRSIDICSSILEAPIRRLPLELLSQVFAFAGSGDSLDLTTQPLGGDDGDRVQGSLPTAHTLIRVCKYWRDLAFQTPAVWNHFVILDDSGSLSNDRWTKLANIYGRHLIRVEIRLHWILRKHKSWELPEHLKSLFELKDQFVELKVHRTDKRFIEALTAGPPMAKLRKLTISKHWFMNPVGGVVPEYSIPLEAPNLERLHLKDVRLSPRTAGVQWLRLTHFTFTLQSCGVTYPMLLDVLRQPLHLVHLRLNIMARGSNPRDDLPPQPIVMPYLQVFEITDLHLDLLSNYASEEPHPSHPAGSHFLSILSTPALTHFEVGIQHLSPTDYRYPWIADACENIATFLQRAPCLASVRMVYAPGGLFLRRGYDGPLNYVVLDASGSAADFSNIKSTDNGVEPRSACLSSFQQARCLEVTLPLSSSDSAVDHFVAHCIKQGDAFMHPPRGCIGRRQVPVLQEQYAILSTVSRDILRSRGGVVEGDRVARIIWAKY